MTISSAPPSLASVPIAFSRSASWTRPPELGQAVLKAGTQKVVAPAAGAVSAAATRASPSAIEEMPRLPPIPGAQLSEGRAAPLRAQFVAAGEEAQVDEEKRRRGREQGQQRERDAGFGVADEAVADEVDHVVDRVEVGQRLER